MPAIGNSSYRLAGMVEAHIEHLNDTTPRCYWNDSLERMDWAGYLQRFALLSLQHTYPLIGWIPFLHISVRAIYDCDTLAVVQIDRACNRWEEVVSFGMLLDGWERSCFLGRRLRE